MWSISLSDWLYEAGLSAGGCMGACGLDPLHPTLGRQALTKKLGLGSLLASDTAGTQTFQCLHGCDCLAVVRAILVSASSVDLELGLPFFFLFD